MQEKKEMNGQGFTRRQFVKGAIMSAAGVSLLSILPGCGAAASSPADSGAQPEAKAGDNGIFIQGGDINMDGQTYTLEFIRPVKLVAMVNGEQKETGIWRSGNKHLVSVDPDGTIRMRDGVGGYDVDVSWSYEDITYRVTFHTAQNIGSSSLESADDLSRGDFMIRLGKYFGWPHYNAYMDDGTDIDDNGEIAKTERVRNFFDVTGKNDYVKPIEAALDMGVLTAASSDECFYPLSAMTREDAAVILVNAFKLSKLDNDYLAAFSDAGNISKDCYDALNTLFGYGFMRGRTNDTVNPTEAITDTEERIIMENIGRKFVGPVWAMPVSGRKFVRCRPEWFCPTEDVTVHWRTRGVNISHKEMEGLFISDRDVGVTLSPDWGDWYDYIPGYTTVPMFGLNNNWDLPYDNVYFTVECEAYATKDGLQDGPVSTFRWRIDRPAWHDFAFDKLHDGGANYPTVYRYFDNFQAAAYYIEGSEMGVLYDGLMPTHTTTSLIDRVNEVATKPWVFVLGHNHGDHKGAMCYAANAGKDIYMADRVGPLGGEWSIETYAKDYTSANAVIDETITGVYEGSNIHAMKEGDVLDLGNVKLEALRLPGHEDASVLLYDRANGLLFSSDIYGVNRYWVADQFGAKGVKQDLLLSLHQQLMDAYAKDGASVKELYTGHNRIGVSGDYLMAWENCLQKLCDIGPDALSMDLRGDGAVVVRDGNTHETMNWQAFSEKGKQVVQEYVGKSDGKVFRRIETDLLSKDSEAKDNLYFDYKTNAHLSNISFKDAELVGHDFKYHTGFEDAEELLEDGRLKFALENKFVPMDTEYEVKVPAGQSTVTFTPIAMSNRIQGMKVNGKPAASRCPVTVAANGPCVIEVTGPDGSETIAYTLSFVN